MKTLEHFYLFIFLVFIGCAEAITTSAVVFSGPEPGFADISLNNFIGEKGPETKWAYKYTARAGQKLSIHFFTKLEGNVDLKVYDGPTNASPTIDISSILNNSVFAELAFSAPFVSATGGDMLVEITALPSLNTSVVQDFQAIVTDHQNKVSDGCSTKIGMGFNVGIDSTLNARYYNISMNGNNCINILHAVDLNNNPTITSFLELPKGAGSTKFYKNLKIAENNELISNVLPFPITDRNVLLVRKSYLNLWYYWGYLKSAITISIVNFAQTGSFMTRDYSSFLPNYLQTPVIQSFTFSPSQLKYNYSTATLEFSILKSIGFAKLNIVATDNNGKILDTKDVKSTDTFPMIFNMTGYNIKFAFNDAYLPYHDPTGLFATYKLKSLQSFETHTIIETSTHKSGSHIAILPAILFSILLLFV